MINAAGILFREPSGKVLIVKRDGEGDHAGEWAFPGGKVEGSETPEETADRETMEELGVNPEGRLRPLMRNVSGEVDFTTFVKRVAKEFEPKKLVEHTAFEWVMPQQAADTDHYNLHPGALLALKRLSMNELEVGKAIASGELSSPQFYTNMWLFAIRITGTGLSYRGAIKEHVWRDKSIYLNDDFLERCQGLAVIWVHPDGLTLNAKEFADRIIGTVMYPYIKDEEVWGIAKIYDDQAAREMRETQISTSPGVSWDDPIISNTSKKLMDGSQLLIEGDPSLLDHIAVVKAGVWDKGGPAIGVQNDLLQSVERVDSMTPEEDAADKARKDAEDKMRADKARADADAGTKLDKILSHMDSLHSRMDAFEEKEKARDDAARADAEAKADTARKDAASRRDAEHDEWKKADAAMCARDDADEEKDRDEFEKKGDPKDVAADKARSARKDRMSKRSDSESGDKEEEDKKKEEKEKMERDDAARADAAGDLAALRKQIADQNIAIAALEAMSKGRTDDDQTAIADAQARVDSIFRAATGKGAPMPMNGETLGRYDLRLHGLLQPFSTKWKGVDLRKVPGDALPVIFDQVRADADVYSREPTDLAVGQLREVVNIDARTGQRMSTFVGKDTFIKGMSRPPRYVTGIRMKHD